MVGKERNFGLDLARAVSILLVLFRHKFGFSWEGGIVGVQIFFVLSGFLIGQILISTFAKETFTFIGFWRRRWFRTLPLYYLMLLFKILVHGNPYGWKIIVYFLFLQANILGIDFFPASWSLVVEEWFYVFLPLLLWVTFKFVPPPRLLAALIFSSFAIFLIRFIYNYLELGQIIYQFDCLLLGVILAHLKIHYPASYFRLNNIYVFLFGVIALAYLTMKLGEMDSVPLYSPFERVIWYFLVSILIGTMIPFVELSEFLNTRLKKNKTLFNFFTSISILTYALYLIHPEIYRIKIVSDKNYNACIQFALLFVSSYLIHALYEYPMTNLRDAITFANYRKTTLKALKLSTLYTS